MSRGRPYRSHTGRGGSSGRNAHEGEATHEAFEILLVKAVDGELTSDERSRLDAHLASCRECRRELADFLDIKETTDMIADRMMKDAQVEPHRERPQTRVVLGLGFVLLLIGALALLGFSAYSFFSDAEVPLFVKVATSVVGAGALVLLGYVVRVRMRGLEHDPYSEIDL